MRIPFQLSILASAVILAGCGGGGGGPGNVNTNPTNPPESVDPVRPDVEFYTPVAVDTYAPMQGTGVDVPVADIFAQDLNNDNVDEVIVGGRKTQPSTVPAWRNFNMQLYGWNTGSFSNETGSWFSGSDNVIVGTEPAIRFGDFNGDGNMDMFSAPGTDMDELYGNPVVFTNTGSNGFARSEISLGGDEAWSHDSWVADINGDGRDDIVMSNIGGDHNLSVNYGNADGTFTTYTGATPGGAGVSVADYLNDGTMTVILTDTATSVQSDTKLFSIDISSGNLVLTEIATLPASYFYNSEFDDARTTAGLDPHEIRNFSMDFNNDGVTDVVVVSNLSGNDVNMSAMQFLRNDGGGKFTDVTDSVLVDYDHDTQASYQPIIMDINNDGLDDILLSASDWVVESGNHDSTRVLVQSSDGKFVEKYDTVFSDFYNQIANTTDNELDNQLPITIIAGPDGEKYLFTSVLYEESGNVRAKSYLAKIGSTGTITPQTAADIVQANWPYLSDASVNAVLSQTSPLSLDGVEVVDLASALNPVGNLTVNSVHLTGSLSAPGLNTSLFNGVQALDKLGRNYSVDLDTLASNGMNTPDTVQNYQPSQTWSSSFAVDSDQSSYAVGTQDQYTAGYTTSGSVRYGFSHTRLDGYSPWLNMSGVFGSVESSEITELTLYGEHEGNWAQFGWNRTKTEITPGLVTDVSAIDAVYLIAGKRFDGWLEDFEIMTGIQPKIVAGTLGVKIPESVDNKGNLQYHIDSVQLQNQIERFARFNYTYQMPYEGKIKFTGSVKESGHANAGITFEMPL